MAGLFCKRFSKKFIFILKLALANCQPALALSCKRVCKIFNIVLQDLYLHLLPHTQHHSCKRFLQHVALFSSKLAFFFPIFTLNAIFTRDFCNMLHFSLLDSPFSYQHSISPPFLQEIFATCCTFLFFKLLFSFPKSKSPQSRQACFRGNHDKFYFAFGPRPYFFR